MPSVRVIRESGLFKAPSRESTGFYEVLWVRPGTVLVADERYRATNGFLPVQSTGTGSFWAFGLTNAVDPNAASFKHPPPGQTIRVQDIQILQTRRELPPPAIGRTYWIAEGDVQILVEKPPRRVHPALVGLGVTTGMGIVAGLAGLATRGRR